MLINITNSSPLSLSLPFDGFMGLAGAAMLMNIISFSLLSLDNHGMVILSNFVGWWCQEIQLVGIHS